MISKIKLILSKANFVLYNLVLAGIIWLILLLLFGKEWKVYPEFIGIATLLGYGVVSCIKKKTEDTGICHIILTVIIAALSLSAYIRL